MADAENPYGQIQSILRIVLASPALLNGSGPFTRTLLVTDKVADFRVTEKKVEVHPGWATEHGPLDAAKRLLAACRGFDQRRAEARRVREAELRAELWDVVERIRRYGAEHLIDEAVGAPVERRRSLTRSAEV